MRRLVFALVLGIALAPVPALADYPPSFTPDTTLSTKALNCGITVTTSSADATTFAQKVTATASKKITARKAIGRTVAPTVSGLPKSANAVLKVNVDGCTVVLGTSFTSAKGGVQFPAVKFYESGTYTFSVTTASSSKIFKFRLTVR